MENEIVIKISILEEDLVTAGIDPASVDPEMLKDYFEEILQEDYFYDILREAVRALEMS